MKAALSTLLLAATAGLAHAQCDNTLLLAPDRQPLDNLGYAVSAGGGWLAMGAYLDDNVRGTNAGSVYMWKKVNGSWQYYSRMQCPDNGPLYYGQAVSTDGTTMVVNTDSGVFVSERHADGFWYPAGWLPASPNTPITGRAYGQAIAVRGDRIAVGDWTYDYQGKTNVGAVHMYRKTGGAWQYHVTISNPTFDSSAGDQLGYSVALAADGAVVVGAPGFDWHEGNSVFTDNGCVFCFVPSGGSYALPPGGRDNVSLGDGLNIGKSIAVDGRWIAVGVPEQSGYGAANAGDVSVLHREADNSLAFWAWGAAYPPVAQEKIGTRVAISGNRVIASGSDNGRALEFQVPAAESDLYLQESRIITGSDFTGSSTFGYALAYDGEDLFVGDRARTEGANLACGAGFLFPGGVDMASDTYEFAPVLALPASVHGCTSMATSNSQNMGSNICGTSRQTPDVWYQFTAAQTRLVTATLIGDYDTVLSVHGQEPRGWDSFAIACNDDIGGGSVNSRIQFTAVAGTTYHLRCSGFNGDTGGFTLTVAYDCPADFNADGFLDFFDYDDYVACFETGTCPAGKTADFNGDQFADFFDYDDFVTAFEAGC